MSDTSGILIQKPVSLLNKKINFNFGSFFTALTKAGANAAVANFGNIPENIVEVAASVGLGKEPGEVAWDLILRALIQAMWTLAEERKDLLQDADNQDIEIIVKHRLDECLKKLELQEITIDINFFDHPENLVIIEEIKTPFSQWLESFGVSSAEAKVISNQIPSQFVYALHKEWLKNSDKYQSLINNLNSPFVKATERQQAWKIYSAWLENQVNERMFDEAFGLKQVYVPLRAYYKRKIKVKKSEAFGREEDKFEQVVVDLETEVENWLNKADSQDAMRVISGGPGSGKSSFAKIFAANQAKKGEVRVLFIPLHRFEVTDNLINAVGNFVLSNGFIKENPLQANDFESRLLIIFDGLFEIKNEEEFAEVLEEIALACWHGDGRTTTVKKIEKICSDNSHFQNLFAEYQQATEAGITRLLTAFYFRQGGVREQEKTFEFTHKSFGEYLAARRIVRELDLIHQQLEEHQKNRRKGWDEKAALKQWAILCGISPLNEYLFSFIFDEMRLQETANVEKWQQTLCNLISFMLREGMPMEDLKLANFYEENRQARNAEEALLVVLNACARVTKKVSEIKWHSPQAFGVWISRLRGQRLDFKQQVFCLNYLSYLNLQKCILIHQDFLWANLQQVNLQGAELQWANLQEANLEGADLQGANLYRANLEGANLEGADLQGANLYRANLEEAYLQGTKLQGANLEWAKLQGANLQQANLQQANLQGAKLQGANLQQANLQQANLVGTILEGKDLTKLNTDTDSSTV